MCDLWKIDLSSLFPERELCYFNHIFDVNEIISERKYSVNIEHEQCKKLQYEISVGEGYNSIGYRKLESKEKTVKPTDSQKGVNCW